MIVWRHQYTVCFTSWHDCFYLSCHLQVLLVVFSIIRRKFWDYGRLALVADNEQSVHDVLHYIRTDFQCEILTRIVKLTFFFGQFALFLDSVLCESGPLTQHAVAMDTCHPLCPAWMTLSMKWYVKKTFFSIFIIIFFYAIFLFLEFWNNCFHFLLKTNSSYVKILLGIKPD